MQKLSMKVDHIGYAVRSIAKAREFFELLGFYATSGEVIDITQKSRILFLTDDNTRIELIEPISEDSPTVKLLSRIGPTPYHLCFTTKCFDRTFDEMKDKAIVIMDKMPAQAFEGRRVAFF